MTARGITYHVVPGAAHGMMWDEPDGFVAAVKAALAGS
jgi:pimeloyl-ACP methyl ester carboxylesterase